MNNTRRKILDELVEHLEEIALALDRDYVTALAEDPEARRGANRDNRDVFADGRSLWQLFHATHVEMVVKKLSRVRLEKLGAVQEKLPLSGTFRAQLVCARKLAGDNLGVKSHGIHRQNVRAH